jgi:nitrite reductase/ring-hydroxylating ferredoxin subunit
VDAGARRRRAGRPHADEGERDGAPILLYRSYEQIHAMSARCTHAGGPLDEGAVDDFACTVQCPWHQSLFRLLDGSVVHGPASIPEPAYDVRVEAGRIEVRRRPARR